MNLKSVYRKDTAKSRRFQARCAEENQGAKNNELILV
jgi:hypothetical protein